MKSIILTLIKEYVDAIDLCLKQSMYNSFICLELLNRKLGIKLKRITTCHEYDVEALEFAKTLLTDLYEKILVLTR